MHLSIAKAIILTRLHKEAQAKDILGKIMACVGSVKRRLVEENASAL
ncbi:hypothetical protein [Rosenbergiella australiborealis]|uniref:Uncharacterized protein n=1 Tax=Rosenbergiella australiborealis TaxID=1544696 RepID=A0ABS5T553_9GAMM|nr:hypothetical protein [Rosenbergiella australiborealis]MBT0727471.1 hypothetical protein [Rosenbergiella australiborealis]